MTSSPPVVAVVLMDIQRYADGPIPPNVSADDFSLPDLPPRPMYGPSSGRAVDTPLAVVSAILAVFVLSPMILCGNALLLSALYRFKRLRTPSNYLVASLASSDLGVGVFLPVAVYLETSPGGGELVSPQVAALCVLPYCLLTALCCASLLVMAAIAVDRFTSLAQPLRYNNLITHRSVERYIAALWVYAVLVGNTPLAARLWWYPEGAVLSCSGPALLRPAGVPVFLMCAVYLPCAVLVLGCYSYVYLVARNHHRAIYSVETSLRHSHDAPSRYTSTLAITVGLFVCLWLPFQVALVLDLAHAAHVSPGSHGNPLLTSMRAMCLTLPLFASSALNPWVYGYRNGEVRAAVHRVLKELFRKLGLSSTHLGCPHLVTTGADAELNSFASNMRLCPVSVSPMRTTVLLMPPANLNSEANSTTSQAHFRETVVELFTDSNELGPNSCRVSKSTSSTVQSRC